MAGEDEGRKRKERVKKLVETRDAKKRERTVKRTAGIAARRTTAPPRQSTTRGQRICLRILVFLIVVAILTGLFLRAAMGRKLAEDLGKAERLCSEGKFGDALPVLDEIWGKYPRFRKRTVAYLRGVCLANLGQIPEAKVLWERVVGSRRDDKYYPASRYQLTHLQEIEGQYEEVCGDYEKILSEFGDSDIVPDVMLSLGNCYGQLKRWQDARAKYEEVLSSSRENSMTNRAKKKLEDLNVKVILSLFITEDSLKYDVKPGDTLEKIASKFDTTVELIRKANQLGRGILPIGRTLKITPNKFEIHVDSDKNTLTLESNGRFFKEYPVGTGKHGRTPIGTFKIVNKQVKPVWYSEKGILPYGHPENVLGTRWMGLDRTGYGIHGTTQPETVGKHSSRGCLRLYNKDVEELFMLVTVGTPVIITGTTQSD